MSSILDIDLDYFNLLPNPVQQLHDLFSWADCPVIGVVERHHKVLPIWKRYIKEHHLTPPTHILHVDEHHDMMNEKEAGNIANVMYRAMVLWPECRVYWMVDVGIDSPSMWLEDETWEKLRLRFKTGKRPRTWPKPDFMTICTSPDFVSDELLERLMKEVLSSET